MWEDLLFVTKKFKESNYILKTFYWLYHITSKGVNCWTRYRKSFTVLNITVAELNDSETLCLIQKNVQWYFFQLVFKCILKIFIFLVVLIIFHMYLVVFQCWQNVWRKQFPEKGFRFSLFLVNFIHFFTDGNQEEL